MTKRSLRGLIICLVPVLGSAAYAAPPPPPPGSSDALGAVARPLNPVVAKIPLPTDFVGITAGNFHTCAWQRSGKVYCWGRNNVGQMGQTSNTLCTAGGSGPGVACINRPTFNRVIAGQVEAGADHTCVILPQNGLPSCWGQGQNGQLGAGIYGTSTGPVTTSLTYALSAISSGGNTTCAVAANFVFAVSPTQGVPAAANSQVMCWGNIRLSSGPAGATPMQQIGTGQSLALLATGDAFGCATYAAQPQVPQTHQVWCWGGNSPLGTPGLRPGQDPNSVIVAVNLAAPVVALSAQGASVCATQNTGVIVCFGNGEHGNLGNGQSGLGPSTPQPQTVGPAPRFSAVQTALSVGGDHTCALDISGAAWCWGNGGHGELGNNAAAIFATPQPVAGGHVFRLIASGGEHTCAVDTGNAIYCWGDNSSGQLGTQVQGGYMPVPYPTSPPSD